MTPACPRCDDTRMQPDIGEDGAPNGHTIPCHDCAPEALACEECDGLGVVWHYEPRDGHEIEVDEPCWRCNRNASTAKEDARDAADARGDDLYTQLEESYREGIERTFGKDYLADIEAA